MSSYSSGYADAKLGSHIRFVTNAHKINMNRDSWIKISSKLELRDSTVEAFLDNNGAFGFYSYRAAASPRAVERIS
jgi:hypothetical protein